MAENGLFSVNAMTGRRRTYFAVHYLSPDGAFHKGGHLNLDGAKVRKATDKEAVSLFYSFLKHK